jgi:hypothetical protein
MQAREALTTVVWHWQGGPGRVGPGSWDWTSVRGGEDMDTAVLIDTAGCRPVDPLPEREVACGRPGILGLGRSRFLLPGRAEERVGVLEDFA